MKYDVIIIGGGLSSLTAGIKLADLGKRVCLVSEGQNALHFFSGSFDLLGYNLEGKTVKNPIDAITSLPENHPYNIIGNKNISALADTAKSLLNEIGIKTIGDSANNHYRITPIGTLKPTWLTVDSLATSESIDKLNWKTADLINIKGFLDLPVSFLSHNLKKIGTECHVKDITTEVLTQARKSPTEMRASNIAKYLNDKSSLEEFADAINSISSDSEVVLLPSVIGIFSDHQVDVLRKLIKKPIAFVATMPPSVTGIRISTLLKQKFHELGGTILVGNKAISGEFKDNKLDSIAIQQLPDEKFYADNFILATGSFLSHGIESNYNRIYEPIFDLDVESDLDRKNWTVENVYSTQPYMSYGVKVNNDFKVSKAGKIIENLYAIGSVICGNNDVQLSSYAGVSMLTALKVTEILNRR